VPTAAAVVVIGGGAAAGTIVASADPALPARSAAQLLVDVQNAKVAGLSGTVVETADLGLPSLAGITGGQSDADLTKLITGSNTARVWYAGDQKVRLALLGTLGETDVVRNGTDVWTWSSRDNTATHRSIPAGAATRTPGSLATGTTPQEAASAALAAIDPTTAVSTTGSAKVAGRDAYELVLAPKDTASLIGQVRLAIDAKQHIPLRVDVYAKGANNPAVRVAFQDISFAVPDAQQFVFNPPPGAKVNQETPDTANHKVPPNMNKLPAVPGRVDGTTKPPATDEPKVIGTGWTSVVVAKLPSGSDSTADKNGTAAPGGADASQFAGLLKSLPAVKGTWGSGRLLKSSLFSVLLTDDGRVLAGAVAPEKLYEAASK
jgi:outer membrane lipoprotein-sorting protein